eukprot:scaffold1650_cov351-Prasinococcus_capsulatus_cf.AAC.25
MVGPGLRAGCPGSGPPTLFVLPPPAQRPLDTRAALARGRRGLVEAKTHTAPRGVRSRANYGNGRSARRLIKTRSKRSAPPSGCPADGAAVQSVGMSIIWTFYAPSTADFTESS